MGVCGTVRVLIIDFYDSYTNSILQLLQGTRNSDDGTKHSEWSSAVIRFDQYNWYVDAVVTCSCYQVIF
jgi:para-aminobenzoate synthetase